MSNALAIATVTDTLFNVLTKALPASLVSAAHVTVLRPDAPNGLPTAGVNIFLYQVAPDAAWRNADLPTRRGNGALLRRPQVALDLHYLLTFYGVDSLYEQQRLLGAVVRALHSQPALQRADIVKSEQKQDSANNNALYLDSKLSDQLDLVRFTPINFSLEEMSKLWSVFLKTDYVLSLAYVASVVLIETDDPPPGSALPVLKPCIQAVPFSLAVIDSVEQQAGMASPPEPLTITLHGHGFNPESIVLFTTPGKTDPIFGTIDPRSNSEKLVVTLPAGVQLRPGDNKVQLLQAAPLSSPPQCSPHVLSQSNAASFVVLPNLIIGHGSPPDHLIVTVSPPVGPRQAVSLLLSQVTGAPPDGPKAFVLSADPRDTETGPFSFSKTFPGGLIPAGTYLARVRVDTAESRLTVNASGAFDGPHITI